jgi:hypothetical protein
MISEITARPGWIFQPRSHWRFMTQEGRAGNGYIHMKYLHEIPDC